MTQKEFNTKYKQYIGEGWGGLEFDIEKVTDYLDTVMQDMILIPGFKILQIKLKFNMARFYFETSFKRKELEGGIMVKVEERINDLVKGYDRWSKMAALKGSEKEMNERMDIIGQNGNEGLHYEEDSTEDYKGYYDKVLASGMFFEWHPTMTGEWEKDKSSFVKENKS